MNCAEEWIRNLEGVRFEQIDAKKHEFNGKILYVGIQCKDPAVRDKVLMALRAFVLEMDDYSWEEQR